MSFKLKDFSEYVGELYENIDATTTVNESTFEYWNKIANAIKKLGDTNEIDAILPWDIKYVDKSSKNASSEGLNNQLIVIKPLKDYEKFEYKIDSRFVYDVYNNLVYYVHVDKMKIQKYKHSENITTINNVDELIRNADDYEWLEIE